MDSFDRFSCPLESERVNPFYQQLAIQEQIELNKLNQVDNFISNYWENVGLVPDSELIQERLYHLDIDLDQIEERIRRF